MIVLARTECFPPSAGNLSVDMPQSASELRPVTAARAKDLKHGAVSFGLKEPQPNQPRNVILYNYWLLGHCLIQFLHSLMWIMVPKEPLVEVKGLCAF